jgi:lactoylglutathione lyase
MLKLPGDVVVSLEMVHRPGTGPIDPRALSHLVVQVEDLHATVDHLAARGIQADAPSSPDGSQDFWTTMLTDPEGYRIELVQWPAGHADGLTAADFPAGSPARPSAQP